MIVVYVRWFARSYVIAEQRTMADRTDALLSFVHLLPLVLGKAVLSELATAPDLVTAVKLPAQPEFVVSLLGNIHSISYPPPLCQGG